MSDLGAINVNEIKKNCLKTVIKGIQDGSFKQTFIKIDEQGRIYSGEKWHGTLSYYNASGEYHNSSGAAIIEFNTNRTFYEQFFINGVEADDIIKKLRETDSIHDSKDADGFTVFSEKDQFTILMALGC